MLLFFLSSLSLYMSTYIDRCIHVVAQWFQWIQRSFSTGLFLCGVENAQITRTLLKLTQYFLVHGLPIRSDTIYLSPFS